MSEPPSRLDPNRTHDGPHNLKAELGTLAQDGTAELKASLAKLALSDDGHAPHTGARLRNYFLTGLIIVGPITLTVYIAWHFINMVDAWVRPFLPRIYDPESYLPFPVPGVGLLFAVIGLTVIGALAANLLGRSMISAGEMMVGRMPIVRNVYHGLQQIFVSVVTASSAKGSFQGVALIQFPSDGIWSIGFVTSEAANEIKSQTSADDLVSVFVVHGLLPPSGFTCFVPRKDIVLIKMSVEDAARIILSAGMANPQTRAKPE